MLKFFTGLFFALTLVTTLFGQVLTPLDSYPLQHSSNISASRNARTTAVGDTLTLPFFDDFANYTGKPSSLYWQQNGGTYINNQFGVNPPSIHVATFEGVNAAGSPYSNFVAYGYTDTLTSKPIRLNGLQPTADSVYISFYWQAGGLGGSPDTHTNTQPSFLELEFKDMAGNWQLVWRQLGQNQRTDFARVVLPVTNPVYFHNGFQFRFRSAGIQRGTSDTWNLDYIYLNSRRNPNWPDLPDIALAQQLGSLLERYTAMPVNQFFAEPVAEINDSVFTRLNNFNNLFAPIAWRGYVKSLMPTAPADTFLRGNAAIPPLTKGYLISGKPNAVAVPNGDNAQVLKHAIFLSTRERDARLRQNDTVSRLTELSNYFAYDDGTPETNFSLNNSGTRQLAYRFDANIPDHVRAVRVYLTKTNVPGTVMNFRIWNDDNGRPAATAMAQRSFIIPPVDSLNRFYEISFSAPVPVNKRFYIGYNLTSSVNSFVNIGFDLNENAPDRISYNNGGGWVIFNEERGALMLRAVTDNITSSPELPDDPAIPPGGADTEIKVYPNPSAGKVWIKGNYQELCLLDIASKVVLCKTKAAVGEVLDVRHLAKGLYVLRLVQKEKIITRKLVISH